MFFRGRERKFAEELSRQLADLCAGQQTSSVQSTLQDIRHLALRSIVWQR